MKWERKRHFHVLCFTTHSFPENFEVPFRNQTKGQVLSLVFKPPAPLMRAVVAGSSFLLIHTIQGSKWRLKELGPCNLRGDLNGILDSQVLFGAASAAVGIWGVNQQIEDFSLYSLSLPCPSLSQTVRCGHPLCHFLERAEEIPCSADILTTLMEKMELRIVGEKM